MLFIPAITRVTAHRVCFHHADLLPCIGGGLGGEVVSVFELKNNTIYHFFIGQYVSLNAHNINPFTNTKARVDVWASGIEHAINTFYIPTVDTNGNVDL